MAAREAEHSQESVTPEQQGDAALPPLNWPDPTRGDQIAYFRLSIRLLLVGILALTLLVLLSGQGFRALVALPFPILALLAWWLVSRGQVQRGFQLIVYGMWSLTLLSLVGINGVHGPSVSVLAVVLLVGGWQVGGRAVVALTVLTPVFLFGMAYASANAWPYPVRIHATPYYAALVQSTVMLAAGALGYYMHRALGGQVAALERSRLALNAKVVALSRSEAELRQRDREIGELNRSLERRVEERTAELERAVSELKSFSYSVSHDLRGPLRSINGYAHTLGEDERDRLSEEGLRYLGAIEGNARRMGQLIDGLLELARIGRSDLAAADINMTSLATEVADELKGDYPDTTVLVGDLPAACGDPILVRQVFRNLLGNAMKYSSREERPEVRVDWDAKERAWSVEDNGVGFEGLNADKLFGTFQRLHRADEFEGTGIGLAIVKSIVDRHGGYIWADAEPGEGAVFYFTLEAEAEAPDLSESPASESA